ncbi:MAG TPA: xylulokinase [Anaerolineae bacterium]|nr:xylulokinase [Anaerolineae bacterium]HOQ98487.1 xylulokinase [Anaerolineae bacterium]HPL28115.1 xylulokinase [Anaerolineae bacterium]
MPYLLGIDIGTSRAKAVLIDLDGNLLGVAGKDYAIDQPQAGWAEQDPEAWWRAATLAVRQALAVAGAAPGGVVAIGLAGQMHGAVLLLPDGRPARAAIIWPDRRSPAQVERATRAVGLTRLGRLTGNRLAVGMAAASLLWLRDHEPDTLAAADRLVLPKDYVGLKLTGRVATDVSDASGTLLYDTARRRWATELLAEWKLPHWLLPEVLESSEVAGRLRAEAAEALGLAAGTLVVAGGADQACQALGSGLIDPGLASCTIGTGGQLLAPLAAPLHDPELRLHTFCHALPGRWYSMGATLAAGLSLGWFRERFAPAGMTFDELAQEAATVPAGAEGLIFLPYLVGERTPHFDPGARGAFIGLTLAHGRGHAVRAIMEGVAFALRDSLELMRALGPGPAEIVAAGGGGAGQPWQGILASVFGLPVMTASGPERTAAGAALLAGLGAGLYAGPAEARARAVRYEPAVEPRPADAARYQELYALYRELYPALKQSSAILGQARD